MRILIQNLRRIVLAKKKITFTNFCLRRFYAQISSEPNRTEPDDPNSPRNRAWLWSRTWTCVRPAHFIIFQIFQILWAVWRAQQIPRAGRVGSPPLTSPPLTSSPLLPDLCARDGCSVRMEPDPDPLIPLELWAASYLKTQQINDARGAASRSRPRSAPTGVRTQREGRTWL